MLQIDKIPHSLLSLLSQKGIDESTILLCAKSDISPDRVYCDNWLIATKDDLLIVGGVKTLTPKKETEATLFLHPERLECNFSEISYTYYPLKKLCDFEIEALISDARLVAWYDENGTETKTEDEAEEKEENAHKKKR